MKQLKRSSDMQTKTNSGISPQDEINCAKCIAYGIEFVPAVNAYRKGHWVKWGNKWMSDATSYARKFVVNTPEFGMKEAWRVAIALDPRTRANIVWRKFSDEQE